MIFTEQIPAGWYDPIKPALILPEVLADNLWLGGFDEGFLDNKKTHAYGFTLDRLGVIYVNEEMIPAKTLKDWGDLLDPRWKGKIVMADPRVGGPGNIVLAPLRMELGDEGLKKLLVEQQPVLLCDSRQLAEWIVRGRYPIAIGATRAELSRFQKEGLGTGIVNLWSRTAAASPAFGGVLLMNRAPHPNAAKVFLNWLLGREAQQAWARSERGNSRRLDVASGNPATKPDPKRLGEVFNIAKESNAALRTEADKRARSLLN